MLHFCLVEAAEREGALHAGMRAVIGFGDRITHGKRERQRFLRKGRHAEVDCQVARKVVAHGKAEGFAVRFHADTSGQERHAVGQLALEWELGKR